MVVLGHVTYKMEGGGGQAAALEPTNSVQFKPNLPRLCDPRLTGKSWDRDRSTAGSATAPYNLPKSSCSGNAPKVQNQLILVRERVFVCSEPNVLEHGG